MARKAGLPAGSPRFAVRPPPSAFQFCSGSQRQQRPGLQESAAACSPLQPLGKRSSPGHPLNPFFPPGVGFASLLQLSGSCCLSANQRWEPRVRLGQGPDPAPAALLPTAAASPRPWLEAPGGPGGYPPPLGQGGDCRPARSTKPAYPNPRDRRGSLGCGVSSGPDSFCLPQTATDGALQGGTGRVEPRELCPAPSSTAPCIPTGSGASGRGGHGRSSAPSRWPPFASASEALGCCRLRARRCFSGLSSLTHAGSP